MKFNNIKIIFFKEIKDALRDRNIMISQFLLPLLLYPIIIIITSTLLNNQLKKAEDSVSRVYIENSSLAPVFHSIIKKEPLFKEEICYDYKEKLDEGKLELIINIPEDYTENPHSSDSYFININYNSTNELSIIARARIDDVLIKYRDELIKNRLSARGLSDKLINPVKMHAITVSSYRKEFGTLIGGVLPFLIILFALTSGFLPALDMIIGEKERGTLETLLVSRITKIDIIIGKFLAVWVTAVTSTLLHFFSSTITFTTFVSQAMSNLSISFTWGTFFIVLLLIFPLTAIVCSIIIAVTMVARSYKEGSNYLSIMTFLMFIPVSIIFSPSLKANYGTSLIPIFNLSILFRDVLKGDFYPQYIVVTFITTFIFTSLALWISLKLFEKEDILFRETVDVSMPGYFTGENISVSGRYPSPSETGILIGIIFLLIFFIGSFLQSKWLIPGVYITHLLFILTPALLFLKLWKYDTKEILRWKGFSLFTLFISLILAFSGMVITIELSALQNFFYPIPDPEKLLGNLFNELKEKRGTMDFLIKLGMISLLPAVCEEILFRGVIQSTLEKYYNPLKALIITAVLFGLFHMNPYRLLPTITIGLYLGYLARKSGSLFPSMIVHGINNGFVFIIVYFLSDNMTSGLIQKNTFLPLYIFLPALIIFTSCLYLLKKFYKN